MRRNGFTFVELMIAIAIGAFVTVTAAAAMRGIVAGRQAHQDLTELSDGMRYACSLVRNDLNNMYRSRDFRNAKFELSYSEAGDGGAGQSLTFYTVSQKKARPQQPEGDVYEVQYFIRSDPASDRAVLMRRCCPVVPGVQVGQADQALGILAPVAEHVFGMKFRCYSGTEWVDEWNEQKGQLPELVEAVFSAALTDGKRSLTRSIFVNIPRLTSAQEGMIQTEQDPSDGESGEVDSFMSRDFSNDGGDAE